MSRLIKRRTLANEACDSERVQLNGKVAKAGAEVKIGDEIEIRFGSRSTKVKITSIVEQAGKETAKEMYKIL